MNTHHDSAGIEMPSHAKTKQSSFWRKLGGGSLSISLIVHAILLLAGLVWVFQIIPDPEKPDVEFIAAGGGGGQRKEQDANRKPPSLMPTRSVVRVSARDVVGGVILPDPEMSAGMGSLGSLGSLSGGDGGLGGMRGLGDGLGDGRGPGPGGLGVGLAGNGNFNPFGMVDPNKNALEGSFYDLKQTRDKQPTQMTNDGAKEVIRNFVTHGWRESSLRKYYKANRALYQTRLMIPLMQAEGAPAAFDCEKEVQPSRWLVVYRGVVTPPKTARYRFVGAGDDVMVVRFNGRHVFDHGFTSGTTAVQISQYVPMFQGKEENEDLRKRLRRDYPMPLPVSYHTYDTTRNWNQLIGGLAAGAEFEAREGKSYPIEILISEIPGGLFCASLLIEEIGAEYRKAPGGSPVFPLFRLDHELPTVDPKADNAPPFDPEGPVWKRLGGSTAADI